ncbi:MAG: hypothetical protein M3072_17235, partial [Candidatus Dormibacteraeota bacterium]|nr:hypothetical protein [Candidatus Dormibacteraeota bacterium]
MVVTAATNGKLNRVEVPQLSDDDTDLAVPPHSSQAQAAVLGSVSETRASRRALMALVADRSPVCIGKKRRARVSRTLRAAEEDLCNTPGSRP